VKERCNNKSINAAGEYLGYVVADNDNDNDNDND